MHAAYGHRFVLAVHHRIARLHPDQHCPGEFAEARATIASKPFRFLASVHYHDGGMRFAVCEPVGPTPSLDRGEPLSTGKEWPAVRDHMVVRWATICSELIGQMAAESCARESLEA